MILAFGTYDLGKHPRFGVLLDGLRSRGQSIVEINEPLGLSTAERVRMLRQPWRVPALGCRLAGRWLRLTRAVRQQHARESADIVLVGYMGHFDVLLARMLFRRSTIVLDHLVSAADTASDRGASRAQVGVLSVLDRVALRCANVAIVDTEEHRQRLPDSCRGVVVSVGARTEWFQANDQRRGGVDQPLSIIFFGMFTPLHGTTVIADALAELLRMRPEVRVTMVGSGQDSEKIKELLSGFPQIEWIEWVEPPQLPSLVAGHDVCLGIFGTGAKARRVVPNKVWQGLAAGCVVVTSDTPPQRRLLEGRAVLVPPGDSSALASQLVTLCDPEQLSAARERAAGLVTQFTGSRIVEPLLTALECENGPGSTQ